MNNPVSAQKLKALESRMAKLNVLEEDIEEKFVRCQGSGGCDTDPRGPAKKR